MLLALIALLLGIVVEALKWPQDRSAAMARYQEAEDFGETMWLLLGLVLGHPVVRWLIAYALAHVLVAAVLGAPSVLVAVKDAIDTNQISNLAVHVLTGLAISVIMIALALAARRVAR